VYDHVKLILLVRDTVLCGFCLNGNEHSLREERFLPGVQSAVTRHRQYILYSNTSDFAASSFVASHFLRFSIITTFPNFVACFALSPHFVTTARHPVSFVVQSLNISRLV
jgi:hypothetical protein